MAERESALLNLWKTLILDQKSTEVQLWIDFQNYLTSCAGKVCVFPYHWIRKVDVGVKPMVTAPNNYNLSCLLKRNSRRG